MKKYKYVFFDLDDTLWDFKKNSNQALANLFDGYGLKDQGLKLADFLNKFHEVNDKLWKQYNYGRINKEFLRSSRFKLIFRELGYHSDEKSVEFGHEYLALCPYNKHLIEGALELLEYLHPKYSLNVMTNGFEEIAHMKLNSSSLEKYFDKIVTSEKAGHKKPSVKIFEYAINLCSSDINGSIMIGNDRDADIMGAKNAGMDQVYYNPDKIKIDFHPTYEVSNLVEIMNIL